MTYRVNIKPAAQRYIKKLPPSLQIRIIKRLKGFENRYRIRVGDYRIIYEIHDNILLVVVLEVGHRSDIYRRKK
ncbi:MAG: type II toxin-antitoxin system RelE/ParE family toxin [Pseudomonadota bacterium]